MAARRPGETESQDRPDVCHAVLRRKRESGNRAAVEYYAGHGGSYSVAYPRPPGKRIPRISGRCGMSPADGSPMDPKLEQAMSEIRDEQVDPAVIEAAAARVWTKLSAQASELHGAHIRDCADFQTLIPEYRAGHLSPARATLLKDHLNNCVACRRVYEGRVVSMP